MFMQACLEAIVWTKLFMARDIKLAVDIRVKYYEEMLRCLRGCGFPRHAPDSDNDGS